MKIITFQGGLGNQMFQYVYYQYLRSQYPEETFYGFYPKLALKDHNGLEINKWFEVDLPNTCLSSDIISHLQILIGSVGRMHCFILVIGRIKSIFFLQEY